MSCGRQIRNHRSQKIHLKKIVSRLLKSVDEEAKARKKTVETGAASWDTRSKLGHALFAKPCKLSWDTRSSQSQNNRRLNSPKRQLFHQLVALQIKHNKQQAGTRVLCKAKIVAVQFHPSGVFFDQSMTP